MVGVTLKTALAAGIAWQLATMLPGFLPQYAYYAPLGALTVMYSALYDSLVEGLRAVCAVSLGVLVSVLLHLIAAPDALTVAVALGVGMVLGSLRQFGDQGSWVPIAALFVFTAGSTNTPHYVAGYVSQLTLGAVVGLVINTAFFAPLGLHEVERATRAVRRQIVRVLTVLVDLVDADEESIDARAQDVEAALADLPETRQRLRIARAQARRAQHGNPRRRRWRREHSDVLALATFTDRAASLLEDLALEMLEERTPLRRADSARLAQATAALRDVIAQSRHGIPDEELVHRTGELLEDAVPENAPFVMQRTADGLRRCLRIATSWTE